MDIRSFFGKPGASGSTSTAQKAPPATAMPPMSPKKVHVVEAKAETLRSPSLKRGNESTDVEKDTSVNLPSKKKAKQPKEAAQPESSSSVSLDSLTNLKVAVTGVFSSIDRTRLEELILENGAKLSTSITGKTNILVVGHALEDGRAVEEGSKYRTAVEKGTTIMDEQTFFTKFKLNPAMPSVPTARPIKVERVLPSPMKAEGYPGNTDLWVDRHKPKTPAELVGHAELVRKLTDWLKNWNAVHLRHSMKIPYNKENPGAKAVLLSGPPGIGKSSLARIVAEYLNFSILELNASDARNKSEIDNRLVEAVTSRAMTSTAGTSKSLVDRLVIMDEVDGMGGSDRGGMAELIKVIKSSKVPIICICNDRQSPKVRGLANNCYDLRVKRPVKSQIAARLVAIAREEGLDVDANAAELLVEQSGNDIRSAINSLQMWKYSNNQMRYMDVKTGLSRIEKDRVLRHTPFDACGMMLGGQRAAPFDDRYNSFFIDYSLSPLLVEQNYIDSSKNGIFKNPALDEAARLEALAAAADLISDIDLVGSKVRGLDQHWELLPAQAVLCVAVGNRVQGFQPFPAFPAWLGKYSSTNKSARLTRELSQHMSLSAGGGFRAVRQDYVPYMRNFLLDGLIRDGKAGIEPLIHRLEHYGLTKEDFMESMKELQFQFPDPFFADRYESLDSQLKSALTRTYNSSAHMSQTAVPSLGAKKAKAKAVVEEDSELLLGGEDGEEVANDDQLLNDEEEETEDADVELLKSKLSKAPAKGKAKSETKANTGKRSSAKAKTK